MKKSELFFLHDEAFRGRDDPDEENLLEEQSFFLLLALLLTAEKQLLKYSNQIIKLIF